MQKPLWKFIDNNGTFEVDNPERFSRLYFPLANEAGLLSNITPNLKGSIKTGQNSFLMLPVSTDDLHNIKSGRNFWVRVNQKHLWSVAGVSSNRDAYRETSKLTAGLLWHKLTRVNHTLGIEAQTTNFVPSSGEKMEIMLVTLKNISSSPKRIEATAAIPIFGRSADNLRDHRHVTSLLHRTRITRDGVLVTPTMTFDERGHRINRVTYGVLGMDQQGGTPVHFFPTAESFLGEGGNLERPWALFEPEHANHITDIQGKEAMGAFTFKSRTLAPSQSVTYIIFMAIADREADIAQWLRKFRNLKSVQKSLEETRAHWIRKASQVSITTHDAVFDGWLKWVSIQPVLRKIFGNSFLPDFDYGRGGRGWRDIWQDCLGLLLTHPDDAKKILMHNFGGVRFDGSNATIISSSDHEFIADRNNISRVWMDHGVWPFLTTELYMHQSGDTGILFKKASYFRDHQLHRSRKIDTAWTPQYGNKLKTRSGRIHQGTLLEHILIQHLIPFFNVGTHGHIRLENADWNDGLDMAARNGESVTFTAFYGGNLKRIAQMLDYLSKSQGISSVRLARELLILLDSITSRKTSYHSVAYRRSVLNKFFLATGRELSGKSVDVAMADLSADLHKKANALFDNIQKHEWLKISSGYRHFNGYYDNRSRRVEGAHRLGNRMTLTGQVFPIMHGVARIDQVKQTIRSVDRFLKSKEFGGIRLNTDFKKIQPDLGRAFSFVYGDKENGAYFSHMSVMYANALYRRGFVAEGYEVLKAIYGMCVESRRSKIYPGLPEYFNLEGRGLYSYLTGSASWFLLTFITEVLGVRGFYGDLLMVPKLLASQFSTKNLIEIEFFFGEKRFLLQYQRSRASLNRRPLTIQWATLNGRRIPDSGSNTHFVSVSRRLIKALPAGKTHRINIRLI